MFRLYNGRAQKSFGDWRISKKRKGIMKMGRTRWQERIEVAFDLHYGDPCIKGTRIPEAMIVGNLANGITPEEIREAYPQLIAEDVGAMKYL